MLIGTVVNLSIIMYVLYAVRDLRIHFHFFLKCPTLANQRVTLMNRVTDIPNTVNSLDINIFIRNSTGLHSFLLSGSSLLSLEVNTCIFSAVRFE